MPPSTSNFVPPRAQFKSPTGNAVAITGLGDPAGPAGPVAPTGPAIPGAPAVPAVPTIPGIPAAPFSPAGPCGPSAPTAPCGPSGPAAPGEEQPVTNTTAAENRVAVSLKLPPFDSVQESSTRYENSTRAASFPSGKVCRTLAILYPHRLTGYASPRGPNRPHLPFPHPSAAAEFIAALATLAFQPHQGVVKGTRSLKKEASTPRAVWLCGELMRTTAAPTSIAHSNRLINKHCRVVDHCHRLHMDELPLPSLVRVSVTRATSSRRVRSARLMTPTRF